LPEQVKELFANTVTQISCGYFHSAAITAKGELFTWGHNPDTRLAHKPEFKGRTGKSKSNNVASALTKNVLVPKHCTDLKHLFISQVSCGTTHTLMLDESGRLFAAGSPENG
jgi:alpha-tubulin suppressor-like RCC1 family protein